MKDVRLNLLAIIFTPIVLFAQGITSDNYIAALKEYDEIIAMRGHDYLEAYLNRGLTHKMLGDFEGAIQDLNQVIEVDATDPEAYKNRGNIYMLYGYHFHAMKDYTKAINLDKTYAEAYHNRGLAQFLVYSRSAGCFDLEQAAKYGLKDAEEKLKYFCVE